MKDLLLQLLDYKLRKEYQSLFEKMQAQDCKVFSPHFSLCGNELATSMTLKVTAMDICTNNYIFVHT